MTPKKKKKGKHTFLYPPTFVPPKCCPVCLLGPKISSRKTLVSSKVKIFKPKNKEEIMKGKNKISHITEKLKVTYRQVIPKIKLNWKSCVTFMTVTILNS